MKSIVVFYSLEGNCQLIGYAMSEALGSSILELKMQKPVSRKGLLKYFKGGKSALTKSSPLLTEEIPDLSDYDLILIGAPVWAGTFAPAIRTFASEARLENKNLAFFACSGGGSTDKCIADMKALFEGNKFLGQISFVSPSSKNTHDCVARAKEWANKMSENNHFID